MQAHCEQFVLFVCIQLPVPSGSCLVFFLAETLRLKPRLCFGAGWQQRALPLKSKQKLCHAHSVPCVTSARGLQGNPILPDRSMDRGGAMPMLTQPGGKIPLNFGEFGQNKDCMVLANQFGKESSKEALLLSNFPSAWAFGRRGRGCWRVMLGIYFLREAGAWTQTSVPLSARCTSASASP